MKIETYLTFPGTAEAAITFYADVFGSAVTDMQRFSEMPGMGEMSGQMGQRIGHARADIGGRLLMVSDSFEEHSGPHEGFHGFNLSAQCQTVDEARGLFERLFEGGTVIMPMGETFWAAAFGMCRDRFGVPWMVNCDGEAAKATG